MSTPGKVIGLVVLLVVGLIMFPLIQDSVDSIDVGSSVELFTATEDAATEETFTVANTPIITGTMVVQVNGVAVTPDSINLATGLVTLADADSDVGDSIRAAYDWERTLPSGAATILPMVPIFFILFLLGIAALGLRKVF